MCKFHRKKPPINALYVALSRVTSIEGLYIIDKLPISKTKSSISTKTEAQKAMDVKRTTKSLKLCYDIEIKGNILKIAYLNVNSIKLKLQHISCDPWYKQFDMLIFSEAKIEKCSDEQLKLDNFTIAHKTSDESGVICYCRNDIYAKYHENLKFSPMIQKPLKKDTTKYHTILIHFKLENVNVITGYKSPRTPFKVFEFAMKSLYDMHQSKNAPFIILGDFNINTIEDDSSLSQFLSDQLMFQKALEDEVSTTNFNTQIDTIFIKNISHHHSGIYETYFSDHKPIFIGISDSNTSATTIAHTSEEKKPNISIAMSVDLNMIKSPIKRGIKRKSFSYIPTIPPVKKIKTKHIETIDVDTIDENQINNGDEIVDMDTYDDSHVVVRTEEEIQQEMLKQIEKEVLTPWKYFTTVTMNHIGEIISRNTGFKFQCTLQSANRPEKLKAITNRDDIQFLFEGTVPNQIGHWICIRYLHRENEVHIYDSYNRSQLPTQDIEAIKYFYPRIKLETDDSKK